MKTKYTMPDLRIRLESETQVKISQTALESVLPKLTEEYLTKSNSDDKVLRYSSHVLSLPRFLWFRDMQAFMSVSPT